MNNEYINNLTVKLDGKTKLKKEMFSYVVHEHFLAASFSREMTTEERREKQQRIFLSFFMCSQALRFSRFLFRYIEQNKTEGKGKVSLWIYPKKKATKQVKILSVLYFNDKQQTTKDVSIENRKAKKHWKYFSNFSSCVVSYR